MLMLRIGNLWFPIVNTALRGYGIYPIETGENIWGNKHNIYNEIVFVSFSVSKR